MICIKTLIKLFVLTIFVSCSNQNDEIVQNDKDKINSVLNIQDKESQLVAFRMLDSYEKYELWKNKLMTLKSGLKNQQKELVEELLQKIKPSIYDVDSDYKYYFNNIYSKEFKIKAIDLFGEEFTFNNFYTLSKTDGGGTIDEGTNCNCLRGNFGGWDCGVANGVWCHTPTKACLEVDGCGLLNSTFCDGICKQGW